MPRLARKEGPCANARSWEVARAGPINDIEATTVGLFMGAVVVNMNWVALGQFNIELYPTNLRNTASSFTGLLDPFTGIILPQLIYLQKFIVCYQILVKYNGVV
jgi:hypothetical protein